MGALQRCLLLTSCPLPFLAPGLSLLTLPFGSCSFGLTAALILAIPWKESFSITQLAAEPSACQLCLLPRVAGVPQQHTPAPARPGLPVPASCTPKPHAWLPSFPPPPRAINPGTPKSHSATAAEAAWCMAPLSSSPCSLRDSCALGSCGVNPQPGGDLQWVCRRVWDRDPWVLSVCVCVPKFFILVALRCSERACKGACVATACHATHEWAVCEWVRGVCVSERCTWGAHGGCVGCSRVCKHARCIHQSACARGGHAVPPSPPAQHPRGSTHACARRGVGAERGLRGPRGRTQRLWWRGPRVGTEGEKRCVCGGK